MTNNSSIVLGGGCFWCLEAAYLQLKGVITALPGYAGGDENDASYDAVCSGRTGHAEVVRVVYDPSIIAMEDILAVFWLIHDPTSLNRQGADAGSQYASVIYYENESQKKTATDSRDSAQELLKDPIVTRIEPLPAFYEAEAYHHNYFENNPGAAYCQVVIEPKLAKLRTHFSHKLAR